MVTWTKGCEYNCRERCDFGLWSLRKPGTEHYLEKSWRQVKLSSAAPAATAATASSMLPIYDPTDYHYFEKDSRADEMTRKGIRAEIEG